ncbi:dienelactone hydrolase family protein [Rhodopseudomonas sp. P2A-2r]|uniref:dienelactone hydrolase family protein n=1 Tax=Rhodopseudomonas sp. P2A-2r TaxID=2991972 RepID=UPI002234607A|nr:dienelactone hydrolase family protein [Rhodopseudomonas sp. P2A-2r]UZE51665.1 dienelactone hydrolase family protein [Rhodopseudomonas sp. P2A-2r]
MRHAYAAIAAALLLSWLPASAQEPSSRQIAARVELHPIPSLTLSDQQFLSGDGNGKPVTVTGEFRVAQGTGRMPVIVLMHGSGGVGPNVEPWTQQFNAMGISTFVIDGFTGRGLTSVNTDQAQLGRLNFIIDIYRTLDILAKHPRVDPDRIILMGFSRGGQAVLYASVARFQKLWNRSGLQFAAYIPFYPDCGTTYRTDADVVDRPIRIFHGMPDDYNPVASCKAVVQRLQDAKHDVVLTEYPDAQHGFDTPLNVGTVTVATGAQSVRDCKIQEADGGALVNAATDKRFTYKDDCVRLNPHVGGNAAATQAARLAVGDFVRKVLKLE